MLPHSHSTVRLNCDVCVEISLAAREGEIVIFSVGFDNNGDVGEALSITVIVSGVFVTASEVVGIALEEKTTVEKVLGIVLLEGL